MVTYPCVYITYIVSPLAGLGGGISWRPPAYSLFLYCLARGYCCCCCQWFLLVGEKGIRPQKKTLDKFPFIQRGTQKKIQSDIENRKQTCSVAMTALHLCQIWWGLGKLVTECGVTF